MGFLNFAKKVIAAPTKIFATVIEKTGDILFKSNVTPIWKVGNALQSLGEWLTPECYKSKTATVSESIDFGARCKEYYDKADKDIVPILKKYIESAENQILQSKRQLHLIAPEDIFEQIKIYAEAVNFDDEIKFVKDSIARIFSLDNKEFKEKIEIESDSERKNQCVEFVNVCITKIGNEVLNMISKKQTDTIYSMVKTVSDNLETQIKSINELKKEKEDYLNTKDPKIIHNSFSEKVTSIAYSKCILSVLTESNSI